MPRVEGRVFSCHRSNTIVGDVLIPRLEDGRRVGQTENAGLKMNAQPCHSWQDLRLGGFRRIEPGVRGDFTGLSGLSGRNLGRDGGKWSI